MVQYSAIAPQTNTAKKKKDLAVMMLISTVFLSLMLYKQP